MNKSTLIVIFLGLISFMGYCNKKAGGDSNSSNDQSTGPVIVIDASKVIVGNFTGFGTEFNQNVYSAFSAPDGITSTNMGQLETKVKALKSQYVRIFFDSKAWPSDPNYSVSTSDFMNSFIKTVKLAQDAGATTINITYWHTATRGQMAAFAGVLYDLIIHRGFTAVKEVTIQNEPNSTRMTLENYKACYTSLDQSLTSLGIRNRINFIGGDLVQTNQQVWYSYMESNMSDLLAGYSSHIYWDDNDASKPVSRLTGIANILKAPGSVIKPVYITEYGVRGSYRPAGDSMADPGYLSGTASPVSTTVTSALQNALFQINGMNLGFAGFIRWDCYKARYDHSNQYFSCIGSAKNGYPLYPLYYMTYLFTHTSEAGWKVISSVQANTGNHSVVAAAMTDPAASAQTVYAINMSEKKIIYKVAGLIPNRKYTLCNFNNNGDGLLDKSLKTAGATGILIDTALPRTLKAITTLDVALPKKTL